jgi:hypothetical protein
MPWPNLKFESWESFHQFKPKWAFQLQMAYLFSLGVFVILYRAEVIDPGQTSSARFRSSFRGSAPWARSFSPSQV